MPAPTLPTARACAARILFALRVVFAVGAVVGLWLLGRWLMTAGTAEALRAWAEIEGRQLFRSHTVWLTVALRDFRAKWLAPTMQAVVAMTSFLSAMVAADRLFHFYMAVYALHFARTRPEAKYSHNPLPDPHTITDTQAEALFPTVVVQLPMFNEREVCQGIIDACCRLDWPKSRMLVQVLDDSTDPETRDRVAAAVAEWTERGVRIEQRLRSNRQGYKAGAMVDAEPFIWDYEYVAIFDADFQPDSDFLLQTIPYLHDNPRVAMVQSRWVFANAGESLLTRVQEVGLNYHVKCEQVARFASGNFFNMNGTAGVWRRAAIADAGGWNCRTTVEDMDLSLRAFLKGWEFVYLYDVTCVNELPSNYDAYRKQQHRWSCGPMQLWRKGLAAVWASPRVSWTQKLYLVVFFFGTRMCAAHVVSFVFYCLLVPICVLTPEVTIPYWALVYVPMLVVASTTWFTPRGWAYAAHFVLFENAMSVVKLNAMVAGLLELSSAHEWVVTAKLGGWMKQAASRAGLRTPSLAAGLHRLASVPAGGGGAFKLKAGESEDGMREGLLTSTEEGGGCGAWAGAGPAGPPAAADEKAAAKAAAVAEATAAAAASPRAPAPMRKIYYRELAVSALFGAMAFYGAWAHARWHFAVFLGLQGIVFAMFGLNLVN